MAWLFRVDVAGVEERNDASSGDQSSVAHPDRGHSPLYSNQSNHSSILH